MAIVIPILMGLVLGFLAGLGVGGGSLLILWLTLVVGLSPADARWINLAFFLTAAGAVSVCRWKKGTLKVNKLLPAILAGCIAAGIFAFLRRYFDSELLRKCFGYLLLFTGLRELFYRPRNAK